MIVARVVGSVWATRKEESLHGMKLMIVRRQDVVTRKESDCLVAVDQVGAGIGELVIVATGSSARLVRQGSGHAPIDAAIVGIIDEMELGKGR